MTAREVVRLLDLLEGNGIDVWLDGGWGVDALLGHETREHDDLDLVCERVDSDRVVTALEGAGYEVAAGAAPLSFVLVDSDGRQVDVHPVTFDEALGGGVYPMEDGGEWVYPSAGFEGRGTVARRPVRCLSPEVQVLVHDGYELEAKDFRELWLLHERFGVELPAKYAERALAVKGERASATRTTLGAEPVDVPSSTDRRHGSDTPHD